MRLYGQERNLMTSSIARMNCFLHGIEDFQIVRGDTLSDPKFIRGDRLMQFDVVLANPPYSIKQWDRAAFAADPWGRNIWHPTARTSRLRLLAAHSMQPQARHWALGDPIPTWRTIPSGRGRDEARTHRG